MKKVIGLIMAAFLMVACAQQAPVDSKQYENVVKETLDTLRSGNLDNISDLVKGQAEKDINVLKDSFETTMSNLPEGTDKEKAKKMMNDVVAALFTNVYREYEIKKVEVGEKIATVKVRVKGINKSEIMNSELQQEVQKKVLDKITELDLTNMTQEELMDKAFGFFPEAVQEYLGEKESTTYNLIFKVDRESKKIVDF